MNEERYLRSISAYLLILLLMMMAFTTFNVVQNTQIENRISETNEVLQQLLVKAQEVNRG